MRNETLLMAFNSSAPPYAATDLSTIAFAFVKDSVVRLCETALDAATRSVNTKAKDFFITFPPHEFLVFTISGIRLLARAKVKRRRVEDCCESLLWGLRALH